MTLEAEALAAARVGVALDAGACIRAWDRLEARYGYEVAREAWAQACAEFDAVSDGITIDSEAGDVHVARGRFPASTNKEADQ